MKSIVEEYKSMFDVVLDIVEIFDFIEITGRCGGDVETYRIYKDGTVVQR